MLSVCLLMLRVDSLQKSSNVEEEEENQRKFTSQKLSHQKTFEVALFCYSLHRNKKFASR